MTTSAHHLDSLLNALHAFEAALYRAEETSQANVTHQAYWSYDAHRHAQDNSASHWNTPTFNGDTMSSRHVDTDAQDTIAALALELEGLHTTILTHLRILFEAIQTSPRCAQYGYVPSITVSIDHAGSWMTIACAPTECSTRLGRLATTPNIAILHRLLNAALDPNPCFQGPAWRVFYDDDVFYVDVHAPTPQQALEHAALSRDNAIADQSLYGGTRTQLCTDHTTLAALIDDRRSHWFPDALTFTLIRS